MDADDASSADMRRLSANPDADPLALDDETVERLLTGELSPAQAPPGYAEVAALLAATAAPPTPDELAGEAAALAELRVANRPGRAVVGFRRAARPPRRRRVGLLAAALVGALAMGGVAAAATGHVPAPLRDAARSIGATVDGADPAPPAPPGSSAASGPTPSSVGQAPGSTGPGAAGSGPGSTATGHDNEGLCKAYLAGRGAEQGNKLDATAFQRLAKLAGGRDKIASYCEKVVPGWAEPKKDEKEEEEEEEEQPPPSNPGQGQGSGQGQGGPPVSTGGGSQGRSEPGTPSPGR
jgi:hypothetical protein